LSLTFPFLPSDRAYLRLFGATIGKGTAINRGTTVWDIEYLTIGNRTSVGFRCLLIAVAVSRSATMS